jgi:hypothetical protein
VLIPAVEAGFANICVDGAWGVDVLGDCADLSSSLNSTTSSLPSLPEHDMFMNDVLNLDGLTDSGNDMDFTWNPETMMFGQPTTGHGFTDLFGADFDASKLNFDDLSKPNMESFTIPLFPNA